MELLEVSQVNLLADSNIGSFKDADSVTNIPRLKHITLTSYLPQISQIISVEKNLSCGEISDFCKEFEQFMAFYRNLCRFCSKFVWRKSLWRKNDKYEVF